MEEINIDLEESPEEVTDEQICFMLCNFLEGQTAFDGSPLTQEVLCSQDNIDLIRHISLMDGIDILYSALEDNHYVGADYVFCMRLQTKAARTGIPKELSGGMMILYCKYVMGYDL